MAARYLDATDTLTSIQMGLHVSMSDIDLCEYHDMRVICDERDKWRAEEQAAEEKRMRKQFGK